MMCKPLPLLRTESRGLDTGAPTTFVRLRVRRPYTHSLSAGVIASNKTRRKIELCKCEPDHSTVYGTDW